MLMAGLLDFNCKLYLVGQVSPVSAWVSWNQVNSLLLQSVQRLRDVVRQDGGLLAEVALQVGPRLGLVGDGELVVAGGDGGQVRDGIPACESSPRCTWPFAGGAVAAPVQHNLLEVGTLQKKQLRYKINVKCRTSNLEIVKRFRI